MAWNIPPLFAANVHSKWQISRSPCTDQDTLETLKLVVRKAFDERIESAERIDEGTTSDNFRVVGIPKHSGGIGVLHLRSDNQNTHESIKRLVRLTDFVQRTQTYVVELNGKLWQCGPFIEGDHFRGRIAELVNAAGAVADLQQRLRVYDRSSAFPQKSFGTMNAEVWDKAAAEMPESRTRELYHEHRKRLTNLTVSASTWIEKHRGPLSTLQLVHGDIHPQNLIMDGSRVAAIIDFGNVSVGTLGMDLGMACHRLVRQYTVCRNQEHGEFWENSLNTGLRAFLEAYQDAMPDLTSEHLHDMPHFMQEILLRKIGFNLTLFAEGKRTDDMACSQIERFIGLLNEVDEMDEFFAWY